MQHSVLLGAYLENELDLLRFLGKRLGSPDIAADIAHDLYLKLCRIDAQATVRDGRAYLFSMAANLATDHLRVERRRGEIRAAAHDTVWNQTDDLTPERHAVARAELAYLATAIEALPARCRQVFYLNRYEGCSQAEIAESLGIGVTTVYKDLKTVMAALVAARRRFRGHLSDDEHGNG